MNDAMGKTTEDAIDHDGPVWSSWTGLCAVAVIIVAVTFAVWAIINDEKKPDQPRIAPVTMADEVVVLSGPVAPAGRLYKIGDNTVAIPDGEAWVYVFDNLPNIADYTSVRIGRQTVEVTRACVYDDDGRLVEGAYTYGISRVS